MKDIYCHSLPASGGCGYDKYFTLEAAASSRGFHRLLPEYRVTPLVSLPAAAERLGVADIRIKDESPRFGLNAFKGLGGSYAAVRWLAERFQRDTRDILRGEVAFPPELTFVTATDGNHGRGIAWAAAGLGIKSLVLMPKGSSPQRLANIRGFGGEAYITEVNYDDTVRQAAAIAEEKGWPLLQDTLMPTTCAAADPRTALWIMQGYLTMALEAAEELTAPPTHIFLQAGVGSMAGALAGFFADLYGSRKPRIIVVEPHNAACIYRTALADDGRLRFVGGELATIMAGLACGEPCAIGWELLRAHADHYLSISDDAAMEAMRFLARPSGGDPRLISGESGAAGFGALLAATGEGREDIRAELGLDSGSRVLCFSTEGATDEESYRRIVGE